MEVSQYIDLTNYVDRWMNNYIIYHYQHFRDYGDLGRAIDYFNQKYLEQRQKMMDDALQGQIDAMIYNMKGQGQKAASGINLVDALSSGNLLEETLNQIADGIDQGVQAYQSQVGFDNYEAIIEEVKKKFNKSLTKGNMTVEQVNQFFSLIMKGVELAGSYDKELLDGLTKIGKFLSGNKTFTIDSSYDQNVAVKLTADDVYMTNKIIEYLTNACDKLKEEGSVSTRSFSSTINNIFSTVIGERISKGLLAKGTRLAAKTADNAFNNAIQSGKVKLRSRTVYNLGGTRKDENDRVSKVDIFNQRAFSLSVTENGQSYDIELGSNTSVKWYRKANARSSIGVVGGTPLGSYFKAGTEERYLAYNVITHSWSGDAESDFHLAYRALRAATAATFFTEWLTGTGGGIMTAGENVSKTYSNKVQFLMVNGRVFSVMRIIRNICEDLMNREATTQSADMPFNMSISGAGKQSHINTWQGGRASIPYALLRSKMVTEVVNTLKISAHLNGRILFKYMH